MPLLAVDDLEVTFRTRPGTEVLAVRGVSLQVDEGETLAIVGESGSGKSVTMMAVAGLLPGNAEVGGSISFGGQDVTALSAPALRQLRARDIGIVFQDPMSSLNPVHRVVDQVAEALRGQVTRREATRRAMDLLTEVGIPDVGVRARHFPHQFSGGMRQRVMIAMALASRPRLLVADEPTTALDVTVQAQIIELVRRLQEDHGTAVAWITHDLGVVAQIADRVDVMYAGRVVESGPCRPLYREPFHPYTAGLLRASPRLDTPHTATLLEIPGQPPDPCLPTTGCPYAARCPISDDRCRTEVPPTVAHGDRRASCWKVGAAIPDAPGPGSGSQVVDTRPASAGVDAPLLEVDDIAVTFSPGGRLLGRGPQVVAVDGVTLTILPGESVGLVGESGSGKSTVARAVMRIERTSSGAITLAGGPRDAQMVFQDPAAAMNPSLTVGEIIAEPLLLAGWDKRRRQERVAELLGMVELPQDVVLRHPHQFSGGQRQRISIARALALDPSLLICDEAVSALDVSVQAQIINLLARLRRDLGLSMLFIAHDLAVVRHVTERVYVMYRGRIVEHGTREQVYDHPQHPYTQALLAAVPVPDPDAPAPGHTAVDAAPYQPGDPGCPFVSRCPVRVPGLCDDQTPTLHQAPTGQSVACHLVSPTGRASEHDPAPPHPTQAQEAHS